MRTVTPWRLGSTSIDRADEREQDMIMPTAGGSDAEKAAIQIVLNKFKHVFGKPPIGGSKLRPMSIELEQGAVLPRPAAARRVSPEILKEIGEDTPMRIDNGWTRAARVGGRCWFASPLVAARQPGKVEAPDMRRVSSYQRLLLPAHVPYQECTGGQPVPGLDVFRQGRLVEGGTRTAVG